MCSSSVLAVKGRVGLVEEGRTLGSEHTLMTTQDRHGQLNATTPSLTFTYYQGRVHLQRPHYGRYG